MVFFLVFCATCHKKEKVHRPVQVWGYYSDSELLHVAVQVDAHHHIYLDKGKLGNLLPIVFDWKNVITLEKEPVLIKKTAKGVYDDEVEAMVMRGYGEFHFMLATKSPLKKGPRVRVQVCNEKTGVCYRPEWIETKIKKKKKVQGS